MICPLEEMGAICHVSRASRNSQLARKHQTKHSASLQKQTASPPSVWGIKLAYISSNSFVPYQWRSEYEGVFRSSSVLFLSPRKPLSARRAQEGRELHSNSTLRSIREKDVLGNGHEHENTTQPASIIKFTQAGNLESIWKKCNHYLCINLQIKVHDSQAHEFLIVFC